jgi:hypothetical protein
VGIVLEFLSISFHVKNSLLLVSFLCLNMLLCAALLLRVFSTLFAFVANSLRFSVSFAVSK